MIIASKPLQKTSWAEKTEKSYDFFKRNIDWGIQTSVWANPYNAGNRKKVLQGLYDIYNSKFPSSWFTHVTDPFSAKDPANKQWAAKIRPANIIRPNVDLLRGEYEKREFDYTIVVKGQDGYNTFLEKRKQGLHQNLSQIFINGINDALKDTGEDTQVDSKQVPPPDVYAAEFAAGYKDTLAEDAQADIDNIMEEQRIQEKMSELMKDWLIAGEVRSWKDVIRDKVVYDRVNPVELDHDKSPGVKYIQDGNWACRRMFMTVPDIVDRFYDSLQPGDIEDIESMSALSTSNGFYNYLQNNDNFQYNKVPVYHYVWKSLQKIGHVKGVDPMTGEPYEDLVNDTYTPDPLGAEVVDWQWVTQVLEGYRISENIYSELGPPSFQPNMIADFSKHKLTYNGLNFSDTNSDNLSIAKLGLPFQILYVILFFTFERTVAKSRGKIVLLDKNVIPTTKGWTEEKFFYYSEAQGYMLVDRNQQGADKGFNQYQVLDLGLFEHLSELIKLMDFCKQEYDGQLGINRQMKGQTYASDSASGNENAQFQSSVITEMIFADFDNFVRTEIEGLLDCSQIANRNGKRALYNKDDVGTKILDINPEYYCYSELGIMTTKSPRENAVLQRIRQYTQAMAQNGTSASALVEIETANNVAKLKGILKNIENKQMELAQQQSQNEHEMEVEKIQLQQQFAEYENLLDIEKMNQEYTRKQELVILQGDINLAISQTEMGVPQDGVDITEIMARQNDRDKVFNDKAKHKTTEDNKLALGKAQIKLEEQKLRVKQQEIASKERTAAASKAMDLKIAKAKPKPKPAKAR